ncbi:bifunctional riboflavin kinase/FAD synthetase [Campylobacter pinnipediorum]|uniref:bifunctional riboflavin kinase/FAD synthetase n=1 Tax=Campylobacter pinnipediorum TaxID=1965231 RepID=UPI00084D2433|nr:bifunctional riboflavin kinase/FAD synthetase [Campylobacter pinnipediorum]AQW84711.1 bifunctional riboflavin kinase / FMN adenylyltransferase [Campylobacter pinnipediorum subsp. pinnipediorum]
MPNFSTLLTKDNITAVAIGHFDGIHKGHKELLKHLGEYGGLVVIDKNFANITPRLKRAEYSNYPCFLYEFEDIKSLSGYDFIKLLKKDFKHLNKIVVGFDFRFGKDRAWNRYDLKDMFDGEVVIVDEYCFDGIGVHSSIIRELIKKGSIQRANMFLGREYSIEGEVISGQGIGSKQLVATLNLRDLGYVLPSDGVYATKTKIGNKVFGSVTFIGDRLSTDGKFSLETHIIDEMIEYAPKKVSVCFISKLRNNIKFESLEELKKAIQEDINNARIISLACKLSL